MALRNDPLTFLRMVNSLFAGVIGNGLFVYLDDLNVVSKDLESHYRDLDLVFSRLREAALKANLSKCKFLKAVSSSLGTSSMEQAFTLFTLKFMLLRTFLLPDHLTMSGLFLGLQGTTVLLCVTLSIASPLTRLLKRDAPFIWHDAQIQAFETLKHALTQTPVLAFLSCPFFFHCLRWAS